MKIKKIMVRLGRKRRQKRVIKKRRRKNKKRKETLNSIAFFDLFLLPLFFLTYTFTSVFLLIFLSLHSYICQFLFIPARLHPSSYLSVSSRLFKSLSVFFSFSSATIIILRVINLFWVSGVFFFSYYSPSVATFVSILINHGFFTELLTFFFFFPSFSTLKPRPFLSFFIIALLFFCIRLEFWVSDAFLFYHYFLLNIIFFS